MIVEKLTVNSTKYLKSHIIISNHAAGTSINFAFCEEIINSDIPFIMVVYEKIFGSINK